MKEINPMLEAGFECVYKSNDMVTYLFPDSEYKYVEFIAGRVKNVIRIYEVERNGDINKKIPTSINFSELEAIHQKCNDMLWLSNIKFRKELADIGYFCQDEFDVLYSKKINKFTRRNVYLVEDNIYFSDFMNGNNELISIISPRWLDVLFNTYYSKFLKKSGN